MGLTSPLSWIEIDAAALRSNIAVFRSRLPRDTALMAVVKGEAYGHGMLPVAKAAAEAGADWLGIFSLEELRRLRDSGVEHPVLVMGYIPRNDMEQALELDARITISSLQTIEAASKAAHQLGLEAKLHIKLETGTHRLGMDGKELDEALRRIFDDENLILEGAHTHFANIEDTTEHDYAGRQLERFKRQLAMIRARGFNVPLPHTACTAASILFPETYFRLVRVGIGQYGLWPSKETYLSALKKDSERIDLKPAMTWKTIVAQVKQIPKGAYVGYGCTYKTTRPTRLAILPVGYYNGYDRLLSNTGHVLVRGMRAPIRGRVCMNLTMVDVTDIDGVELEDEVVLLGKQGDETIDAQQLAAWAHTINYEVVTRADPRAPRFMVNG